MASEWQIGDKIQDRWQIYNILKGGMGIVYIVYDHTVHEAVAAKTFQDELFVRNPQIANRFTQEATIWINLERHQNVTIPWFVEIIEGKPFLFLEYVSGGDLSGWIGTSRLTEDLPQVLRFAIQFCDGMIHALSKGIKAHRDVKPQNCLVTEDKLLKVTDFGLATLFEPTFPTDAKEASRRSLNLGYGFSRGGAGTPPYMAPEQFDDAKHVDARADIYSFGVMLFEMIAGRWPFTAQTWEEFERLHKQQPPPHLTESDRRLDDVVQKCLAKDPAERFQSFVELRQELAQIYENVAGEPTPQPVTGRELDVLGWELKAQNLSMLDQLKEALSCCDRALELDPRRALTWLRKAGVLADLGRYAEAINCSERALGLNPRLSAAWVVKGSALHGLKQHQEALGHFETATSLDPNDPPAWMHKGLALDEVGRTEEALSCLDHALSLRQDYYEAWYNTGRILHRVGRYDEAIDCFDRSIELCPYLHEAWFNKGLTLQKLERYEGATGCYDRALELNRSYADALANKGAVLQVLGRHQEALACYNQALGINPGLAQAWANKAEILLALGCKEEALACCDRVLELNPLDDKVWFNKGKVLVWLKREGEAISCFNNVLKINPRDEWALSDKADALSSLDRYEESLECWDRVLEANRRSTRAWMGKATALRELRRFEDALACYDHVLELEPSYDLAWFCKARILGKLGRHEEALRVLEEGRRWGLLESMIDYAKKEVMSK